MEQKQFEAIMPLISADLVAMIADREKLPPDQAIERLYASRLYAIMEREDTKVWYYSTEMLYSLYRQEQRTGKLVFPDV